VETSKLVKIQPDIHITVFVCCTKSKNKSLEFFLANKKEKNNAILKKTVRRGRREANSSAATFLWTTVAYKLGL